MNDNFKLPIHPEKITKKLFSTLPKRTKEVLESRFGLGKNPKRMTLDAIGKGYGITRERVRQIEADGISRIKKSESIKEMAPVFTVLENYFEHNGQVIKESDVLSNLSPNSKSENHVYFLLSLHNSLLRFHENESMYDRWIHGHSFHANTERTLTSTISALRKIGRPVSEENLFQIAKDASQSIVGAPAQRHVLQNWINISKLISKNYFGEWGLVEFPSIKPRGVRDLSYLAMLRYGKPLHFADVAQQIENITGKKVHIQTVHNELIKDDRFVLVGRGLYALSEWGYASGMVRDVICDILKVQGSATKDKIVSLVSQKRFVKPNTISINLENKKYFKKLPDGGYTLV